MGSFVIIVILIFVLINVIIRFGILGKFKVGRGIFKALLAWEMRGNLVWFYVIVVICVMIGSEGSRLERMVLKFDVVL